MQVWRNCRVLSEEASDSSAFRNATCLSRYVLSYEQHFSFCHILTRISGGLLYCASFRKLDVVRTGKVFYKSSWGNSFISAICSYYSFLNGFSYPFPEGWLPYSRLCLETNCRDIITKIILFMKTAVRIRFAVGEFSVACRIVVTSWVKQLSRNEAAVDVECFCTWSRSWWRNVWYHEKHCVRA
jgi:hypothetical protein